MAALPAPYLGAVVAGDRADPRSAAGQAARRAVHLEEDRAARARRQLGLVRLLDWLGEHPGDTWQQRWLARGADAMGNAEWWRPLLAWARPRNPRAGVSTSSNLRVCALLLAGADVIRPSLDWVLTPRAPQNLVAVMARARDPRGFAELSALCAASPAGGR